MNLIILNQIIINEIMNHESNHIESNSVNHATVKRFSSLTYDESLWVGEFLKDFTKIFISLFVCWTENLRGKNDSDVILLNDKLKKKNRTVLKVLTLYQLCTFCNKQNRILSLKKLTGADFKQERSATKWSFHR